MRARCPWRSVARGATAVLLAVGAAGCSDTVGAADGGPTDVAVSPRDFGAADLASPRDLALADFTVVEAASAFDFDLELELDLEVPDLSLPDFSADGGVTPPDLISGDQSIEPDLLPPASCRNGMKDGLETDVDCGGGVCTQCIDGRACKVDADCQSGACKNGLCAGPICPLAGFPAGPPVDVGAGLITLADLNGDGHLDLLGLAVTDSDALSIAFGKGNAQFAMRTDVKTGSTALGLSVGDVDLDGNPDVVVSAKTSDLISPQLCVHFNLGNGSFSDEGSPGEIDVRADGLGMVLIGDVDGDALPDLVVPGDGPNLLAVVRGLGKRAFAPVAEMMLPGCLDPFGQGCPESFGLGDLDGDGALDLVYSRRSPNPNGVVVQLNQGKGVFGPATAYPVASDGGQLVLADLDKDGRPDIATAPWNDNTLSVLLGRGKGTFGPANDFAGGQGPKAYESLAVGDLNGDGAPDLVTTNRWIGTISIFLNNGNGTFAPEMDLVVDKNANELPGIALGDVDGDGKLDITVGVYVPGIVPYVALFLNRCW